jgi:hypothetical protein
MKLIHSEWDRFCSSIDVTKCVTVSELPNLPESSSWVAIKHDVETNVERALQIAVIEAKYSIRATYFVQSDLLAGNKDLLHSIAKLGHEVTYHYDVLDANSGNFDLATSEFEETVKRFEDAGFPVNSVCPHGNPLINRDGWNSNKDFFRDSTVASRFSGIFDLVVQGKEKISSDYTYISDAGFGFKVITDIVSNDKQPSQDISVPSISELSKLVGCTVAVIISTHPHRWVSSSIVASLGKTRFIIIRRVALLASKSKILKSFMSKFYFLAKKI